MARRYPFEPLAAEPGCREVALGERLVPYRVKRSMRARAWRLEYSDRAGLVAVLPHSAGLAELDDILAHKQRWILRQLETTERRRRRNGDRRLRDGGRFLFAGRDYELRAEANGGRPGAVTVREDAIVVNAPAADEAALRAGVKRWLRRQAREAIAPLVAAEAAAMKVDYRRLFFRNQRTRWASCSTAGNLSFNYHVAMAPPEIVRYLVVHELAHRKTYRHGKRFHQLLAKRCPGYRDAEKWLRENEDLLVF